MSPHDRHAEIPEIGDSSTGDIDSAYAWLRLAVRVAASTIGGVGLWSVVVVLPAVQAEFGVDRGRRVAALHRDHGGLCARRRRDGPRWSTASAIWCRRSSASIALGVGYLAAAGDRPRRQFTLVQGVLIGARHLGHLRSADRRHLALVHAPAGHRGRRSRASGNYLAGTIWPPSCQHVIETDGWRSPMRHRHRSAS